MSRSPSVRTRTGATRSVRFLLTLALLPAAGVTLAGVGLASASDDAPRTPVARTAALPAHPEPGDDRGTDTRTARPTPRPTTHAPTPVPRTPEAGDDSGGHDGRSTATTTTSARTSRLVTARSAEPGEDSPGEHHQMRSRTRSADDSAHRSSTMTPSSAGRAPEAGDDRGDHDGRTAVARPREAGDDSGGHGGRGPSSGGSAGSSNSGRHGGSDDGAGHS